MPTNVPMGSMSSPATPSPPKWHLMNSAWQPLVRLCYLRADVLGNIRRYPAEFH